MVRRQISRKIEVPARTRVVYEIATHCDACGTALDWDDSSGELFPNVLEVLLNADECISSKFRKELCSDCVRPVWEAVCAAFEVDPDDTSGSTYNEEEEEENDDGDNGSDD